MDVQEDGAIGGLPVAEPLAAARTGREPDTCPGGDAGGRRPVSTCTSARGRPVLALWRQAWDDTQRRRSTGIVSVAWHVQPAVRDPDAA